MTVEPGHEESVKTACLKNEEERVGLINSGLQDVTVDGCNC